MPGVVVVPDTDPGIFSADDQRAAHEPVVHAVAVAAAGVVHGLRRR